MRTIHSSIATSFHVISCCLSADLFAVNTMCKCETAFGQRTLQPLPPEQRRMKTSIPGRLAQIVRCVYHHHHHHHHPYTSSTVYAYM